MYIDNFTQLYRPNVGVVLFNHDGSVFYGQRVSEKEYAGKQQRWQFPQGGIDKGESVCEAAFRELKEETGVSNAQLLSVTPGWLAYDFPEGYTQRGWIGQRQKWAAMLFCGNESEIDLEVDDHQEFDAWRWGDLEEAPSLIVPFKRPVYEELLSALLPLRDFLRDRK